MSNTDARKAENHFPWKEFLAFLGVIIAAYIGYLGIRSQIEIPIQATQTAEANRMQLAKENSSKTSQPFSETPTQAPTPTLMQVPSKVTTGILFTLPVYNDLSTFPNLMEGIHYKDLRTPSSSNYQVDVSAGITYAWGFEWCAQDDNYLSKNLSFIKLNLLIEEAKAPVEKTYKYRTSKNGQKCYGWSTLISNWTKNEKIKATVQYDISGKIFDGVHNYEPGQYRHDIFISIK